MGVKRTSRLDVNQYPALDVVTVYHERWEIDFGIRRNKNPHVGERRNITEPQTRKSSTGDLGHSFSLQPCQSENDGRRGQDRHATNPAELHPFSSPHPLVLRDSRLGGSTHPVAVN